MVLDGGWLGMARAQHTVHTCSPCWVKKILLLLGGSSPAPTGLNGTVQGTRGCFNLKFTSGRLTLHRISPSETEFPGIFCLVTHPQYIQNYSSHDLLSNASSKANEAGQ